MLSTPMCRHCFQMLQVSKRNFLPNWGQRYLSSMKKYSSVLSVGQRLRTNGLIQSSIRAFNSEQEFMRAREKMLIRRYIKYLMSLVIFSAGGTYAAVPLYRKFCQVGSSVAEYNWLKVNKPTNHEAVLWGARSRLRCGGQRQNKIEEMQRVRNRLIRVRFTADTYATLKWQFKPLQDEVYVHPGETALAFYSAKNSTKEPVVGISTYSVNPFSAGQYFAKIQCFCFEEQLLNPDEEVDMPVFFYIDPDYCDDQFLEDTDEILLHYTFFESRDGLNLTLGQGEVLPRNPHPRVQD